MTPTEAKQILIQFNAWRRGEPDAPQMPDPHESGKAIDVAVEALGDGWINVGDQLPELGKEVLVYDGAGTYISCYGKLGSYFGKKSNEMGWVDGQDEQPGILFVTHWQPIPTPPKAPAK